MTYRPSATFRTLSAVVRAQRMCADCGEIFAPTLISRGEVRIGPRTRGMVILEVIVDVKGRVSSPKVLKGVSTDLDSAATKTVLGWRYLPATLRGKPVPVYLVIAVPSG